jgi:hypothetical protein
MPEISRFLGIIIYMYFDEHPPPHFHAKYGSYEILVSLDDGVVEGRFPRRALRHVLEWYERHRDQLQRNWELAQNHKLPVKVPPLE